MGSRTRLVQAYYDLSALLDAGVPILRSLDIVIEGRQGYFKHVLAQIRESLSQGSSLCEAMNRHPRVFPELDRALLEAAETSGSLGESLKMLSQWHEFVGKMTRRTLAKMIYPFVVLHIAAMILPLPALFLGRIGLLGYLVKALRILLILYVPTVLIVAAVSLRRRVDMLRLPLDLLVLRIPILNQAERHFSICRYAKAFNLLYKAGVPITECAQRATRAVGNTVLAGLFAGGATSAREGRTVVDGFSSRLPAEYRDLWQIGEETGELDKTVDKIAEISGDRADLFFNEFARWLAITFEFFMIAILVVLIFLTASQIPSFSGGGI
jgi:type II secretory pathway component PulF